MNEEFPKIEKMNRLFFQTANFAAEGKVFKNTWMDKFLTALREYVQFNWALEKLIDQDWQ